MIRRMKTPTDAGAASRAGLLPSLDRVLRHAQAQALAAQYGHQPLVRALRGVMDEARRLLIADPGADCPADASLVAAAADALERQSRPPLRAVFNLTGTVLHTNLGRAWLPEEAIAAVASASRGASNLEYDLERGMRGERDEHLEEQVCRLTGAEAATVVNNNAAAVLLLLNSLARRREVPVSRGELIEIGGSFRMPDIMAQSGCRLREVGTTNRTHLADYEQAIGASTALVMKVHPSNYVIRGFVSGVPEPDLARLCAERGVPFAVDLGCGALIDLGEYGLPHEPTVRETLAAGADLVTFSGDKLLGGPQAGIIAGRADLIARIRRNPLKRALRVDKMTVAALSAVLALYDDPHRLRERLPTLRLLTRSPAEIRRTAETLQAPLAARLAPLASVAVVECDSEVGSGAQPEQRIASAGLAITPLAARGRGTALKRLASAFRALPVPVIGRISDDALILDCRCLEDTAAFEAQLPRLALAAPGA